MDDLSLHVLDIAENSIRAGATVIEILIDENIKKNLLSIKIKDNGRGIDKNELSKVLDPFYTTKKGKRIGLGLALLAQSAHEAMGKFDIISKPGRGTDVLATFVYDHIDRKPLGDMGETVMALIGTHADKIDVVYAHKVNDRGFKLGTSNVKSMLDGVPIMNPEVMDFLRHKLQSELKKLGVNRK
ncbi:MAG TPA: ATP-binding protein [bacterium]